MAAKEAQHLFQRLGQANGEASVLQAIARIYSFKGEPRLALEAAKESAMIFKTLNDLHGAAHSLLIEAAAHLARGPETALEPRSKPAKEALAAAEEAYKLCQRYADQDLENHALKVLDAARESFQAVSAPALEKKREVLMAIDNRDRGLLEDMGIRFKSQSDVSRMLRLDPRMEALEALVSGQKTQQNPSLAAPLEEAAAKADPAMERLMTIAAHALSAGR